MNETAYKWKVWKYKADPNEAGKVCEELANTIGLTSANLVDASRPEDAPLHDDFEWDDSVAAEKFRQEQASTIIRNLVVVSEESKTEPYRGFFTIDMVKAEPNTYEPTHVIMSDEGKRNKLLQIALAELRTFKHKYEQLTELSEIFEAIERVTE